jgi:hypothetical protein
MQAEITGPGWPLWGSVIKPPHDERVDFTHMGSHAHDPNTIEVEQ